MPEPSVQLKQSKGETVRITEKAKYRAMAESGLITNLLTGVKGIPRQSQDNQPLISPEAGACLDYLEANLPRLEQDWKTYVSSYTVVDRNLAEMEKESKSAAAFFKGLTNCRDKINLLAAQDGIHLHPAFAAVKAGLDDLYGHYHEMQFGTLKTDDLTPQELAQVNEVRPDPDMMSEYMNERFDQEVERAKAGNKTLKSMYYQYVDRSDEPLFPHEPSPDDIAQGSLGDCYFMASLSAICATNPQIIRSLMKDNGTTVTVPVWRVDEEGVVDRRPVYVTVEKSVPAKVTELQDKNGTITTEKEYLFGKTALWVQMMEKAYAASGLSKRVRRNPDNKRNYEDISIGEGFDALNIIMGSLTQTVPVYSPNPMHHSMNIFDPEVLYEHVRKSLHDGDVLVAATGPAVTANSKELIARYREKIGPALENYRREHPDVTGEDLARRELGIKQIVADQVFHGLSVSFNSKGEPYPSSHEYAVTNAYEENGRRYIVVRNPHGKYGQDPNDPKPFDRNQRGYSAIPLEEFYNHFHTMVQSYPLMPFHRKDQAENFRGFLNTCFEAVDKTLSGWESIFGSKAMSTEFNELYKAMQHVRMVCRLDCCSDYALSRSFKKLSDAAYSYLSAKGADTERDNKRNIRVSVAKACIALADSYTCKDDPATVKLMQKAAAEKMAADRVTFYLNKKGQLPQDKVPDRASARFQNLLQRMTTEQLMNAALKTKIDRMPDAFKAAADALSQQGVQQGVDVQAPQQGVQEQVQQPVVQAPIP